jgi:hypothetical protein
MWSVFDPDKGKPRFEVFGGVGVFRPGWEATITLRNEAESHFRAVFRPGVYEGGEAANRALKHHFAFYATRLRHILPAIASRDYIEFVLHQYEQSVVVNDLDNGHRLTKQETEQWQTTGPKLRRALKYLAERTVLLWPPETASVSSDHAQMLLQAEMALLCAEQLVDLYMTSDKVFSLFPDETVLEVLPEGEFEIFRTRCSHDFTQDFLQRVHRDASHRSEYVPLNGLHQIPKLQDSYLANAFCNTIGLSYSDILAVLHVVIDQAQPPPTGFKIPFCLRTVIVNEVVRCVGFSRDAVEKALAGFTVSCVGMENEGREIYKPKQEYRAYRRGFFEMPHCSGPHLAWSKSMAQESYVVLLKEVAFKQVPPEWRSTQVDVAVSKLGCAVGKWFESLVAENLKKIDIMGLHSIKRMIGTGKVAVRIPDEVGEIDFLGYSERDEAIIVAECKYVRGGVEPRFFRDEINAFTKGNSCHMMQLARKTKWVVNEIQTLRTSLAATLGMSGVMRAHRVISVLVSHYPSCASYFWHDAPCVSLTELILDYKGQGHWPYAIGVFENLP